MELIKDFSSNLKPLPIDMELRFGTHTERLRGILVGLRQPEYLVVEIPRKYDWLEVQDWFNDVATVIIRGVLENGQVIAAATGFLSAVARPQRMVFLAYPQRIETRGLRKAPRVDVELDAVIRPKDTFHSPLATELGTLQLAGTITDVSRGGMGFEIETPKEIDAYELNGTVIEIQVLDEGRNLLKTEAEVRGVKINGSTTQMGLLVNRQDVKYLESLDSLILHSKLIKQAIHG